MANDKEKKTLITYLQENGHNTYDLNIYDLPGQSVKLDFERHRLKLSQGIGEKPVFHYLWSKERDDLNMLARQANCDFSFPTEAYVELGRFTTGSEIRRANEPFAERLLQVTSLEDLACLESTLNLALSLNVAQKHNQNVVLHAKEQDIKHGGSLLIGGIYVKQSGVNDLFNAVREYDAKCEVLKVLSEKEGNNLLRLVSTLKGAYDFDKGFEDALRR